MYGEGDLEILDEELSSTVWSFPILRKMAFPSPQTLFLHPLVAGRIGKSC